MFSCPWQPKWSRLEDASDGSREFPRSYGTMQYCLHGANFASILWPVCDIYIDYFNSRLKDDSKTPKNNSLFQCGTFATLRTLINCAQNAKFHSKREQSGYMKKVLHLLNTCSSLLMQKTSLYKYVQFEPFAKLSYDSISKHYTQ